MAAKYPTMGLGNADGFDRNYFSEVALDEEGGRALNSVANPYPIGEQ